MFRMFILALALVGSQAARLPGSYIIGGDDVSPVGKWPFMVSLWVRGEGSDSVLFSNFFPTSFLQFHMRLVLLKSTVVPLYADQDIFTFLWSLADF